MLNVVLVSAGINLICKVKRLGNENLRDLKRSFLCYDFSMYVNSDSLVSVLLVSS
jgi:hypothetical protein